jgi:hypothetical protein
MKSQASDSGEEILKLYHCPRRPENVQTSARSRGMIERPSQVCSPLRVIPRRPRRTAADDGSDSAIPGERNIVGRRRDAMAFDLLLQPFVMADRHVVRGAAVQCVAEWLLTIHLPRRLTKLVSPQFTAASRCSPIRGIFQAVNRLQRRRPRLRMRADREHQQRHAGQSAAARAPLPENFDEIEHPP